MSKPRIAIVGAGVAGLCAAALLSRRCTVTVYERAERSGGKIRQLPVGNSAIDSGPTVFTMRGVFEDIFRRAGTELDACLSLHKLETLARHIWRGGATLDLFADKEKTAHAIAAFSSERDAAQYLKFTEKAKRVFDTLQKPFLENATPSLLALMTRRNPLSLMGIDPYSSYWSSLTKRFEDPRLRQLFARYATYCGSSPFEAPATLMLIAHVEQQGVWALEGGMQSLADALETVAKANGARFVYDAEIATVDADGRSATGVSIIDGRRVEADAVIINADMQAVGAGFFGGEAARAVRPPKGAQRSQSALTWCLSAEARGVDLSVHNVFFSDDYQDEFDAVFNRNTFPKTPTTYLFAPDRDANGRDAPLAARAAAPERMFILTNAPAIGDRRRITDKEIEECEARTLAHLQACGLTLAIDPALKTATTPTDFAHRFPGTGGALFGSANHHWRDSFRRPSSRTRMNGLYLAGGSVHPGSGVPMAALSGATAANCVMADYGLT
ncbi:MAG: 1-hydroxycarotenoid 3,4-desaturase CrtD [Pseudomonadota bacterium]